MQLNEICFSVHAYDCDGDICETGILMQIVYRIQDKSGCRPKGRIPLDIYAMLVRAKRDAKSRKRSQRQCMMRKNRRNS